MKVFIFVILVAVVFLSVFSFSFVKESAYFSSSKSNKLKNFFFKDPAELESAATKNSVSGAVVSSEEEIAEGLERNYCSEESKSVEFCENLQQPVCGWYTESECNPLIEECVRSVFPNECEACATTGIVYWTDGDCPLHT